MDSASSKNEISIKNSQLDCMRRTVEAQDSSAKAADDATLMRFLRARDFNVQKASQFFLNYLKWRRAFVPLGYIPESEVCNELEKKKIFIQGLDKQGRPIGVILAARHNSNDRDLEEFKRLVVYGLDKICTSSPREQEKFTIIADLEGWGYKNTDIRAYLSALEILQLPQEMAPTFLPTANPKSRGDDFFVVADLWGLQHCLQLAMLVGGLLVLPLSLQNFYPERLGKLLMVHVPYIFRTAWKMVYPFIDKVTKQKIIFVEDKHLKETLLRDIDESQLPEIYRGKLPLVPAQDCITNNSPPVMLSNDEDGFQ